MIGSLRGTVVERNADSTVLFEVSGIGYLVHVTPRTLAELEPTSHYLNDKSIWDWRCYDLLSVSGWQLGKKDEAVKFARMALEANPTDGRLQDNLKWLEENYVATQKTEAS
jgi:hypothetical protein